MKTSVAYLTMLCCYVYYIDDNEKQNNDDVQHIQTYTYSYNNDLWKDELTSYTRVIHDSSGDRTYTTPANTYDAIGNPTKYFGSDLEWDYGRQLRRFDAGSSSVWTTAVKSVVVKWDGVN